MTTPRINKILKLSAFTFLIVGFSYFIFVDVEKPKNTKVFSRETVLENAPKPPAIEYKTVCRTVYDTVTSASGEKSKKARKVCTTVAKEPVKEPVKKKMFTKTFSSPTPDRDLNDIQQVTLMSSKNAGFLQALQKIKSILND